MLNSAATENSAENSTLASPLNIDPHAANDVSRRMTSI